MIVNKRKKIFW